MGLLRGNRWLLRHVDWNVPAGKLVAVLGPNGCGKSTLARVAGGFEWPTEGRVTLLGHPPGTANLHDVRRQVRLVQSGGQSDVAPHLIARDVVLTGLFGTRGLFDRVTPEQREQADELLARVGLRRVAERPYATMSSGERVRALIARSLCATEDRPVRLLLLDEPTAGLDFPARERVLATVRRLLTEPDSPAVVLITHHTDELPPETDDVLLMAEGRVVARGMLATVLTADHLSKAYGLPVSVTYHADRYHVGVAEAADLLD